MSILCSLKNINLSFGTKQIFNDAQLTINHGEKIGLIGLNGMGKSSLFKILAGQINPDQSNPQFLFDKATINQGLEKVYNVFTIDQNFENKDISIGDYFYLYYPEFKDNVEEHLEKRYWSLLNLYESFLKSFHLNDFNKSVKDLSGGEQKKILLSLGLSADANLILWDEPTNHLDIDTIDYFENELLKSGKSMIIISHDRFLLSRVCNKIFHINQSTISQYNGSYSEYLQYLNVEEELRVRSLQKLKNSLRREKDWMNQGIKARGTRSKKRVENFNELVSKVSKVKGAAREKMELSIYDGKKKSRKLLSLSNVSFGFENKELLFQNLNLDIFKGEKIGILGDNGIGKSTLMKILSKELNAIGDVKIADNLKICRFSQKRDELPMDKTAKEVLGQGEEYITLSDEKSIHVTSYFKNFLFNTDEIDRPLSSFSGGELNRLQLAINLKNEADLWIFDEPTNDLDIESIEILEEKLAKFKGNVIVISHDRSFLENITNKIWLIKNKKIEIFNCGYSQVAPYLEACKLENKLNQDKLNQELCSGSKSRNNNDSSLGNKSDISSKNSQQLTSLISKLESEIKRLDQRLEQFDYKNLNQESAKKLEETNELKEALENKLLDSYQELENMSI